MHRTILTWFGALTFVTLPVKAHACLSAPNPAADMARPYDAVVVATVTKAVPYTKYVKSPFAWEAQGNIARFVSGTLSLKTLTFEHNGSDCDNDRATPMPKIGEAWALYVVWDDYSGRWNVAQSYPLSLASKLDKRFTKVK